jgi:hypothetical protein
MSGLIKVTCREREREEWRGERGRGGEGERERGSQQCQGRWRRGLSGFQTKGGGEFKVTLPCSVSLSLLPINPYLLRQKELLKLVGCASMI